MSKKRILNPVAATISAAVVASALATAPVQASDNPFATSELAGGFMLAGKSESEGKCGEGKCGGEKSEGEGKCGEGKCGGEKSESEGKCGEGKCGGDK